jgi:hypothetical protein
MTLYLSGPIAGYPEGNRPAFDTATEQLRTAGYGVLNPFDIEQPDHSWAECVRLDLIEMLKCCDSVAVLDNWQCSRGAILEVHVAKELGLPVLPVQIWLDSK